MTQEQVTDEMLMAFADGELDDAESARIADLISVDPVLAQRAEVFTRSRQLVEEALSPVLSEPVPAHLVASALGTTQDLSPRPRAAVPRWAMAASVAVLAGLAGFGLHGLLPGGDAPTSLMAAASSPGVLTALETIASGQATRLDIAGIELTTTVVGTFPVEQGHCRIFTLADAAGQVRAMSCGAGDAWQVPVAVLETGTGFQAASGAEAIDLYLDSVGAGAALDEATEIAAMEKGWAP